MIDLWTYLVFRRYLNDPSVSAAVQTVLVHLSLRWVGIIDWLLICFVVTRVNTLHTGTCYQNGMFSFRILFRFKCLGKHLPNIVWLWHFTFFMHCVFKKRKVGFCIMINVNERLIIEKKVTFSYPCFDFQTDMDWMEDTRMRMTINILNKTVSFLFVLIKQIIKTLNQFFFNQFVLISKRMDGLNGRYTDQIAIFF